MGIKLFKTKSGTSRRLKKLKLANKSLLKPLGPAAPSLMIEIDDHVLSKDMTLAIIDELKAYYELKKPIEKLPDFSVLESAVEECMAERAYLTEFFNNTCGKQWNDHTNWCTNAALNKWKGVKTTPCVVRTLRGVILVEHRVTEIDLWNNNLHAKYADGVYGEIPDDIEKLTFLEKLNLGRNFLPGKLPATLGNLSNLQTLHLHFNQLTGKLPSLDHLDSLEELWLNQNNLQDTVNELTKLKRMKCCHIQENKFYGNVPEEMTDIQSLERFQFYSNYLKCGDRVQARVDASDGQWRERLAKEQKATLTFERVFSDVRPSDNLTPIK